MKYYYYCAWVTRMKLCVFISLHWPGTPLWASDDSIARCLRCCRRWCRHFLRDGGGGWEPTSPPACSCCLVGDHDDPCGGSRAYIATIASPPRYANHITNLIHPGITRLRKRVKITRRNWMTRLLRTRTRICDSSHASAQHSWDHPSLSISLSLCRPSHTQRS